MILCDILPTIANNSFTLLDIDANIIGHYTIKDIPLEYLSRTVLAIDASDFRQLDIHLL